MNNAVFISYNPNIEEEQTIAIRLHTIGALNGFTMYLPDRYHSDTHLNKETQYRIKQADWFVVFCTQSPSPILQQEILYAKQQLQDASKIIVIATVEQAKNLEEQYFKGVNYHFMNTSASDFQIEKVIHAIIKKIKFTVKKEQTQQELIKTNKSNEALKTLLLTGIGLFMLSKLTE